ncbi:MAG: tyrosine-type recombinase/integrase [Stenotrophomonas maltophilia]
MVSNQLQLETFIAFKKATKGLTVSGEKWLRVTLGPFLEWLPLSLSEATKQHIIQFLAKYEDKPWRRHSFYRAFKTFWKWLAEEYQLENLMKGIPAPKTPDVVLHTTIPADVDQLIQEANTFRDKAIIALLADSGARRSELASIETENLDLQNYRIKVVGKANKEG